MNDPFYRELVSLTRRYRWLVLSVTVVVFAAAVAQALSAPAQYLARLVVRPAEISGKPITEVRVLTQLIDDFVVRARKSGEIPSGAEFSLQVIRQQPPNDIDLSVIALMAKGRRTEDLFSTVTTVRAHLAELQDGRVSRAKASADRTRAEHTANLERLSVESTSAEVHDTAASVILDLAQRARAGSARGTHPVETLYGPHAFPQPSNGRLLPYAVTGLAAGVIAGYLLAFLLAGFRARYREQSA